VTGLLLLNLLFLLAGVGLLWGIRGWTAWTEPIELLGVAYLLGLAAVCVAATVVLSLGGGLSTGVVLVLTLGTAAAGVAIGAARRRPVPRRLGSWSISMSPGALATAGLALLTAVVLAAFARAAYHAPVGAWDAWAFWLPKAKGIYHYGGLDEQLLRALPGGSYPLLVPALDAMDFRFIGSADSTLLGLQYWLMFAGFVFAVAGLLRRLVSPALVWLFLAVAAVLPEVDHRLLQLMADWPLDIFFALAALALVVWLRTGESWLLGIYGVSLAATLATKREGQLLAACLVVGALAAVAWRRRRAAIPIVAVALAAYVVNVPWRIWWTSRHLASDVPDGGIAHFTGDTSRIWPGLRLVLELLFNYHLWLIPVPLAIGAALLGLVSRTREVSILYLVTTALAIVGFAWVIWSDPSLPISTKPSLTPIPRAVGAIALLSIVLAPLLVQPLLSDEASTEPREVRSRTSAKWSRRRAAARRAEG
jgi:hypothetical protein